MTPEEDQAIDAVELARARMIHAHAALQLAYLDPDTPEGGVDAAIAAQSEADRNFTFAMLDWWKVIDIQQAVAERETATVN